LDGTSSAKYQSPTTPATIEDWSDAEQWHYVWKFELPLPLTGSQPLVFTPYYGVPTSDSFLQVSSHITYGANAGGKPCDQQSTTTDGRISRAPEPSFTFPAKSNPKEEDVLWTIPDGALCGLAPWHLSGALPLADVHQQVDLNSLRRGVPLDFAYTTPSTTTSNTVLEWHGTMRITLTEPPPLPNPPTPASSSSLPGKPADALQAMSSAANEFRSYLPTAVLLCGAVVTRGLVVTVATGAAVFSPEALIGLTKLVTLDALTGAVAAQGTKCQEAVKRLAALWKIMRDPPRPDYLRLAQPALGSHVAGGVCGGRTGDALTYCTRLQAALSAFLAASSRLAAIDEASATTMARLGAARVKRDSTAMALQGTHLAALDQTASAARAAEAAAARDLAAFLDSAHVTIHLPAAQTRLATGYLLNALQKLGLPPAILRSLDPQALTAKPVDFADVLTELSQSEPPVATPAAAPAITSVTFTGGPASPSVVVRGTNLGTLPGPSPAGHPSGLNGCPLLAGDEGYDYGTSLFLADPAKNWAGGRYRPSVGETDCIDLVITKFTPREVDFHFGAFYTTNYPKFSLSPGNQVEFGINGASYTTTVKYS
jgi:hypothetical protein